MGRRLLLREHVDLSLELWTVIAGIPGFDDEAFFGSILPSI